MPVKEKFYNKRSLKGNMFFLNYKNQVSNGFIRSAWKNVRMSACKGSGVGSQMDELVKLGLRTDGSLADVNDDNILEALFFYKKLIECLGIAQERAKNAIDEVFNDRVKTLIKEGKNRREAIEITEGEITYMGQDVCREYISIATIKIRLHLEKMDTKLKKKAGKEIEQIDKKRKKETNQGVINDLERKKEKIQTELKKQVDDIDEFEKSIIKLSRKLLSRRG